MSNYSLLPTEVQECFERYAECMLYGKHIIKRGSMCEADNDFETIYNAAEDLYTFLKVSLNNHELIKVVLENEND